MTCKDCMTDRERELWVANDEYLYNLMLEGREEEDGDIEKFVEENRDMVTNYILEASE